MSKEIKTIEKYLNEVKNIIATSQDKLDEIDEKNNFKEELEKLIDNNDNKGIEDMFRKRHNINMTQLEVMNRKLYETGKGILSQAIFKLIVDRNFYGTFLTNLTKEVSLKIPKAFTVKFNSKGFQIVINPFILSKITSDPQVVVNMIEVECVKIVRQYPVFYKSQLNNPITHRYISMACDISATESIAKSRGNEGEEFLNNLPPEYATYDSEVFRRIVGENAEVKRNESASYYYELIVNSVGINNLSLFSDSIQVGELNIDNLIHINRLLSIEEERNKFNDFIRNEYSKLDDINDEIEAFKYEIDKMMDIMEVDLSDEELDSSILDPFTSEDFKIYHQTESNNDYLEGLKDIKYILEDIRDKYISSNDTKVKSYVVSSFSNPINEAIENLNSYIKDTNTSNFTEVNMSLINIQRIFELLKIVYTEGNDELNDLIEEFLSENNISVMDIYEYIQGEDGGISEEEKELFTSTLFDIMKIALEKSKGIIPGDIEEFIEERKTKSKMTWQSVLRNLIGKGKRGIRKSSRRLNRRQPYRLELSGSVKGNNEGRVIVAIDTSGSMSDDIILKCLNEVRYITDSFDVHAELIQFDSEVRNVRTIESSKDLDNYVSGRGGTSFQSVFDYLYKEANGEEKKYNLDEDILLFFSDGYGEPVVNQYDMKKVIWVKTEGYLSVNDPIGKVLDLKVDDVK